MQAAKKGKAAACAKPVAEPALASGSKNGKANTLAKAGGKDNKEVLTTYTGRLPASAMRQVIPSASGDDFAAMHQAIERRFRRAVEEGGVMPDVLLIDGGAGQLAAAENHRRR